MTLEDFLDGKAAVDVMHNVRIELLENGKFKTIYDDGTNLTYTKNELMRFIINNTDKHPRLIKSIAKHFPEELI